MSAAKNINEVTLRVGGTSWGGWKSVRIAAGIERLARDFSLEVTSKWPGSDIAQRVRPGELCVVNIGEDTVLTGYIDATPISYDGNSVTVGIHGRSKTSDLIDCSPFDVAPAGGWQDVDNGNGAPRPYAQKTNTQWFNARLEKIIEYLAKPYRVAVRCSADTGAPLKEFSIIPSSTVFEVIDSLMRKRQVLVTDNAFGDVEIINVGDGGRYPTALEVGKNILAGSAALDYKNVFSEYTCSGYRALTDEDNSSDCMSSASTRYDPKAFGIQRRRKLVLDALGYTDNLTCRNVVEYQKAYRAAKALEAQYTVIGWREAEGGLWFPNVLVRIRDPIIGFNRDMLISEVSYVLDKDGMRTELKVGPQEGFLTQVEKAALKQDWNGVIVK